MIRRPIYVDGIMKYMDAPLVKILTGIRRCGKSTLMQMIQDELRHKGILEEQIVKYNFDSMEYADMTAKELYLELKNRMCFGKKTYLFLDEVQEIEGWEKIVNTYMTEYDTDIYVTGSNSRMMSSEISTHLTGRYISFRIFPLSFEEYLEFRNSYTKESDSKTELKRYLQLGGFPAIHLREYTTDEAYPIVKDIYNSTIFTDIVRRNQIKKVDQLERVVKYAFDNVGNTFSAASIAKYLKSENRKIDNETVYGYLQKLERAYILHRCSRYDVKGKELLKTQEKFYLADPALRYSVLGYSQNSADAMLENIVYLELLRRGYEVSVGKLDNYEIDFIADRMGEKIYIQVTKKMERKETEEREYGRLLAIEDNYPKYVLTTDEFAGGNYQGIKTMHIADFLLNKEY
ncbi:MAG: uncharacterized protein PWP24_849 [Clostridiales bacterium]|nr:uncharacterized protein [Clostridiales bacterium]